MTHHTTLVQRCRSTNSMLAGDLANEFARLERENAELRERIQELEADADAMSPRIQAGDRSRDEVLEEAALVCDRVGGQFAVEAWEPRAIMSDTAREIRRLKTKPLN